jgi:type II secretory pathway component PulF
MAQFTYKARRRSGELVEGLLEGTDRAAALVQLERLGLFPLAVNAAKGGADKPTPGKPRTFASLLPPTLAAQMARRRKPKLQELATFTEQLANLLRAGMPLTMALHSMSGLSTKGIPAEVAKQLKQDVTEGRSLSDAMLRQSDIFPGLVINMVRAGEQSGALEEVLRRMASHFERFAEAQAKFKSAMVYPLMVCLVGTVLVWFFMTKVLPQFMGLFQSFESVELPFTTQVLISTSGFLATWWWLILLVVGLTALVFVRYKSTPSGRRTVDRIKLGLPIVGRVVRLNLFGQFSQTLGTLMRNGVPVLNALKITEQVVPNVILGEAIAKTREGVTDGKTLAQPLAKSGVFPQLMIDLIKIGEETGDVPGALENVAHTYERELNLALRAMTNLIEPLVIIAIAVVVGFILMGVIQAMMLITQNIQR